MGNDSLWVRLAMNFRQGGIAITNIAVGRVLLRLQKAEELRVALEGGGNVPNQYEATAEFGTV